MRVLSRSEERSELRGILGKARSVDGCSGYGSS